MQSALTKRAAAGRGTNRNQPDPPITDAGELLLAELAERRARLRELLGLVHREVAREMALQPPPRIACRRVANARLRPTN